MAKYVGNLPINIGTYRPWIAKLIRYLLRNKQVLVKFRGRKAKDGKYFYGVSGGLKNSKYYSVYLTNKTYTKYLPD